MKYLLKHTEYGKFEEVEASPPRPRHEVKFRVSPDYASSGIEITLTRLGIEIGGWYDSFVGLEPGFIDWKTFDRYRETLR